MLWNIALDSKSKSAILRGSWINQANQLNLDAYVVAQFCPWFKFYFLLFLGMVMYDNEFETKEYKIQTKDKIEPQHMLSKRF